MSDYMFDGDAHDMHSLDYKESIRSEESHVDDEAIRGKESHIDDKSLRDKKLSQNKEFLKKKPINRKREEGFVDICQLYKEKNIIVKYVHDSSTGNMLGHLWSKHRIDKEHPNKANAKYIGVTVTWADLSFVLKEALLTIQPLPSPYTAKNIKDSLNHIINE
ncbi:27863_t:CDS:2 [Gigaspora margarita]|uniref:27863_t:CDS:1 n=1 Tax=Gigaspora margarita TaxID=4874 RepID=A0ABN7WLU3_GIGMA|nr:27863_t:CDS:2 [Gigaspora margarita]